MEYKKINKRYQLKQERIPPWKKPSGPWKKSLIFKALLSSPRVIDKYNKNYELKGQLYGTIHKNGGGKKSRSRKTNVNVNVFVFFK